MKDDYSEIVEYLLDWYDLNARILPWREDTNPYYIWISEIMLQQTRVEAVKPYFDRFIDKLPTISSLANVEEEKLLKLWEGLGYYNRARNLKKAAITVIEEYKGELPASYEELLKLPGIGPYTAGAIASIAYRIPVPAVDGNVLRVTKRVAASLDDITKQKVRKQLEEDLKEIMPKDRPGDFNQSLMELGATICLPNGKPLCTKCPIMHLCKAFHKDMVMKIPYKPEKKPRKQENKTILIIEYQNQYGIRKRKMGGLLGGLYEFPSLQEKQPISSIEKYLKEQGITNYEIEPLGESKHIFTHIEWHMIGYKIKLNQLEDKFITTKNEENSLLWITKQQIQKEYTIPTAFEKYRKSI